MTFPAWARLTILMAGVAGSWVGLEAWWARRQEPALHAAIARGRTEEALALLDSGVDPTMPGRGGLTPLHLAAGRGDAVLVAKLLALGADPQAMSSRGLERIGYPPLHAACSSAGAEVLGLLLRAGADVHATDSDGYTALDRALQAGKAYEAVEVLLAWGAACGSRTLGSAICGGSTRFLDRFSDEQLRGFTQDGLGALVFAAKYADVATVHYLQSRGCE